MTFQEELDAEVSRAMEEVEFRVVLRVNEQLWGSAYGPWATSEGLGHLRGMTAVKEDK